MNSHTFFFLLYHTVLYSKYFITRRLQNSKKQMFYNNLEFWGSILNKVTNFFVFQTVQAGSTTRKPSTKKNRRASVPWSKATEALSLILHPLIRCQYRHSDGYSFCITFWLHNVKICLTEKMINFPHFWRQKTHATTPLFSFYNAINWRAYFIAVLTRK
jgi:hypothetical protein